MRLQFIHADIFYLNDIDTLVCPVNCVGVMGNGLALAFKQRFPVAFFNQYREICLAGKLGPGNCWLYKNKEVNVLCFATKDHWMHDSKLEWIKRGLVACIDNLPKHGIRDVAFPLLGCGKGGLSQDAVIETFKAVFDNDVYEELDLNVTVCL